ncbi:uncharacterized protein TRIADDRAFT_28454 [Trichoplax adhaerens]|uniref:Cytochrome P450 n=1 Tax=Trichoplax adhaerens TaxID=10228 RepID=B3S3A0_TRIAD|nr:hypothetical protein TRIADDRAFT_28454 [Trichoplax adhaerens]EDV22935.1 hypothetical protein TRIADDRAFT_28454 [Trichoplax adhaerens]|eukprot:XP_002114801.1 hypothetical protein TRIADDRAFT_28454 [Trichoplax adhaerens]
MIKAKDEAEDKNDINKTKMLNDKNLVGALIDLFAAGIITTTTTLEWYFLYMIVHPNIQQKVHDELDRVIGRDRYPTLQDRDKLPYLQATILETLRASSVSPLAAPHETIADIKLNNYTLPSKTTVWINTWSVHHDEKLWPNPNEFSPERHLNNDGTIKASSPNLMPFSCGTRACIGETLAKFNLYIIISHLMQHCTFRKVDNQQLDLSTGSSFVMPCKEYQMTATPRIS